MRDLETLIGETLDGGRLVSLVLTGPRARKEEMPHRVSVKPVVVRGKPQIHFEYRTERKATHRNLPADEAQQEILELIRGTFRQGVLRTEDREYRISVSRKGRPGISSRAAARTQADPRHDRPKRHILPEGQPHDFLVRLGVMTPEGKVIAARADKLRQVNRFLEMVADVYDALPSEGPLRVVDFGCGKSMLTFALYHYLTRIRGREVEALGLDLKSDVVEQCGEAARDLGYEGLRFSVGDIGSFQGPERADLVVSLHACDTATDDALARAVGWGARAILAVPCCQHELRPALASEALQPLLRHGILRERVAALVTDALRAELLEVHGYAAQVLEFVETEHTPKNLLIRAVRRARRTERPEVLDRYRRFRGFWGVEPYLEKLLPLPSPDEAA